MNILVIPAWYDISNPFFGSFFHEYCDALAGKSNVTVLNFNYFSFSQIFKKYVKEDLLKTRKYKLLTINYYNPLPFNLAGLSIYFQKTQILKKIIVEIRKYQIKFGNIDVIHIQSVCHNINPLIAERLSKELKIPYIITEHFSGFDNSNEKIFFPFTNIQQVKGIVQKATLRYGVSSSSCNFFSSFFECRFEVMHNLLSDAFLSKPLKLDNHKQCNQIVFLSIGRFDNNKGQLFLINAFAKALKIKSNLILKFVGSGVDKQKMIDLIYDLKITANVFLYDPVSRDKIIDLIDESDVIISSSTKETFGLTIVESFFRGKPVIATKSGGPNELVKETNGVLIECGDEKAMTSSILKMSDDLEKYDFNKIRNDAINNYSENSIISMMLNNYNRAIEINKKHIKHL